MKKLTATLVLVLLSATTAWGQIAFDNRPIAQSGDWQAHALAYDSVWLRPTCVASTQAADGVSSLEVIAFYDEETASFTEPTVHVLTPFDVSFLQVEARMDNLSSQSFTLLPVALPEASSGAQMIGARALFDDREALVQSLRLRNSVSARYFDSAGEVKNIRFSLRGSSATIAAMFNHCRLEFREAPVSLDNL